MSDTGTPADVSGLFEARCTTCWQWKFCLPCGKFDTPFCPECIERHETELAACRTGWRARRMPLANLAHQTGIA